MGGRTRLRPDHQDEFDYRVLSPWLRRKLVSRFGIAVVDAEDLVQESFIRLERYSRADRSRHPRALLMRIASNLSMDLHRRAVTRGGGRHVPLDALEHGAPAALVQPADQEVLIELKRAILELPQPLRETFLLARFTPMTHVEIAAHLGISTKTVEWRIRKAVSNCLERLDRS